MRRFTAAAIVAALVSAVAWLGVSIIGEGAIAAPQRSCGLFRDADGARIGVMVLRGTTACATARRVLRAYFNSHAPCDGAACVRAHLGWTCATAAAYALPRLASCERGRQRIAAYSTAY